MMIETIEQAKRAADRLRHLEIALFGIDHEENNRLYHDLVTEIKDLETALAAWELDNNLR